MIFSRPDKPTLRMLYITIFVVAITILFNPIAGIDLLLAAGAFLLVAHIFLQEKILLLFLVIRPTIDWWRDVEIFRYQNTSLNMNAALALLLLGWCALVLFQYRHKIRQVPLIVLLSLTTLTMFLSTLYSVATLTTLVESIKFLSLMALFVTAYILVQEKKITPKELLQTIAAGAVIPLLFGAAQLVLGLGITTFDITGRIYGTFGHPNVFAFYILFLFILFVQYSTINASVFWRARPRLRIGAYALLMTLLLMTFTRAAWIGFVIFLVIIGFIQYRKMLTRLVLGIIVFYISFFALDRLVITYTDSTLQEVPIVNRLTSRNEDADSIKWRGDLIEESVPIILARKWIGYGYGTFPLVWGDNRNLVHLWDDSAEAHNDYLRLALELGIVGLGLYGLFLLHMLVKVYASFHRSKEKQKEFMYLLAWILTFMAISLSDNMLHHTPVMWMMWAWWGATFAAKQVYSRSPNFLE